MADLKQALGFLRAGLDLAEKAVPVAASFGVPHANLAGGLIDFAQKLVDRVETGAEAFATDDVAELHRLHAALAARNDELAAVIDAS